MLFFEVPQCYVGCPPSLNATVRHVVLVKLSVALARLFAKFEAKYEPHLWDSSSYGAPISLSYTPHLIIAQ